MPATEKKSRSIATKKTVLRKFERLMRRKKYLSRDCSLNSLAAEIGTNRTYLGEVIHAEYGMSLPDYINQHRIEEATRILLETGDQIVIGKLVKKLGYSSPASFFRNFKRIHGISALQWLEKNGVKAPAEEE